MSELVSGESTVDSVADSVEEKSHLAFFGSLQTGDLTGDSTIESAS